MPLSSRVALALFAAALTVAPLAHADPRAEDPESTPDYIAAIAKGEAAFVAKDMAGATVAFQDAVKKKPERMLALYRLGETHMAMGRFDEAISTFESALGKKGSVQLKGKVMFILSMTFERAHKLGQAKEAWIAYIKYAEATPDAKGFPETAKNHIKVIDRRVKDELDYGKVKARIESRQKEKEKEALENAKKDKNNR